jgi:hypothetical protein
MATCERIGSTARGRGAPCDLDALERNMLAVERACRAHTRRDADAQPRVIDIDAFAGPRSSRTSRSPGTMAGAPAVGAGTGVTGAALAGVRAASFPVRLDECTGATLAAGGRCQVLMRLDTFLAGAADATLRSPRGRAVVHDVPLHGLVIGGYTRDGDAEPGSRCKSDTVLAPVTRELERHVATGPTGLGRRGESARPGSQEIACIVV